MPGVWKALPGPPRRDGWMAPAVHSRGRFVATGHISTAFTSVLCSSNTTTIMGRRPWEVAGVFLGQNHASRSGFPALG